jgi:PKD repeat protein
LQYLSEEGYFSVSTDKESGAVLVWNDPRNGNSDIYAQRICSNGRLGWSKQGFVADITASRSGGIAPAEITFDCNNSYSPNGTIIACEWDFGDKTSGFGFNPTHTFNHSGKYKVLLYAKDSIGVQAYAERTVIIYSRDNVSAEISVNPHVMKARGRESAILKFQISSGNLYSEELQLGRVRPVSIYLAPEIVVSSGTINVNMLKPNDEGMYHTVLVSGDPGIATVTVKVDGQELATVYISYTWPLPPMNLSAHDEVDRSLFQAKRSVIITWAANPGEIYTPKNYRIYRSDDGSDFVLAGTTNANVFSFKDTNLSADKRYAYYVKMVDSQGDISDPSAQVTLEPLNGR